MSSTGPGVSPAATGGGDVVVGVGAVVGSGCAVTGGSTVTDAGGTGSADGVGSADATADGSTVAGAAEGTVDSGGGDTVTFGVAATCGGFGTVGLTELADAAATASFSCSWAYSGASLKLMSPRSVIPRSKSPPKASRAFTSRNPWSVAHHHTIFANSPTRRRMSKNTRPSLASGVVRTMSNASGPTACRMTYPCLPRTYVCSMLPPMSS